MIDDLEDIQDETIRCPLSAGEIFNIGVVLQHHYEDVCCDKLTAAIND